MPPNLKLRVTSEPWNNAEIIEVVDKDDKRQRAIDFFEKGKVVNVCPKCRTRWMSYDHAVKCPFCGRVL